MEPNRSADQLYRLDLDDGMYLDASTLLVGRGRGFRTVSTQPRSTPCARNTVPRGHQDLTHAMISFLS